MSSNSLTVEQNLALIQETQTGVYLIQEGILALNRLNAANDFSHLPLALLAQGFERFLKVTYCLTKLDQEGRLPERDDLRHKIGHSVETLVSGLTAYAAKSGYADSTPAAREDHDFIARDSLLQAFIKLMSDFGRGGRYASLDVIVDPASAKQRDDPTQRFVEIENLVLDRHPGWLEELLEPSGGKKWADVYAEMTVALQRFARAIARYFTLGPARDSGKFLTGAVGPFLFLMDNDLGTATQPWYAETN